MSLAVSSEDRQLSYSYHSVFYCHSIFATIAEPVCVHVFIPQISVLC